MNASFKNLKIMSVQNYENSCVHYEYYLDGYLGWYILIIISDFIYF